MVFQTLAFLLLLSFSFGCTNAIIGNDESKAIAQLHSHLDKDKDGVVNDDESCGFLTNHVESALDRKQKDQTFHYFDTDKDDDNFISVAELQEAWQTNPVRKWTTGSVEKWLIQQQFEHVIPFFQAYMIRGRDLPKLAANGGYKLKKMGISEDDASKLSTIIALEVLFPDVQRNEFRSMLFTYVLPLVIILLVLATTKFYHSENKVKEVVEELEQAKKIIEQAEAKMVTKKDSDRELQDKAAIKDKALQDVVTDIKSIVSEIELTYRLRLEKDSSDIRKEMNRLNGKKNSVFGNFALNHSSDITALRRVAGENLEAIHGLGEKVSKLNNLFEALEPIISGSDTKK